MLSETTKKKYNVTESQYNIVHCWVRYHYGKATKCVDENCLNQSKSFAWALIKGKKYEKDINNFKQLCRSCHAIYDIRKGYCLRGHKLDKTNTYTDKKGHRMCKTCNEINKKNRKEAKPWVKNFATTRFKARTKGWEHTISISTFEELWFKQKAYEMKKPSFSRIDKDKGFIEGNCEFREGTVNDSISSGGRVRTKEQIAQATENLMRYRANGGKCGRPRASNY